MKTYNLEYTNQKELVSFVQDNHIDIEPNILVQVFVGYSDKNYILDLIEDIKSALPTAKIIGATNDGSIMDTKVLHHKTLLCISVFKQTTIKTFFTHKTTKKCKATEKLLSQIKNKDEIKLIITFTDGLTINGEKYIKAFEDFESKIIIAGGLAGDNAEFIQTYVFTEKAFVENGCVLVAFYNKDLIVHSDYNFGWERIGKTLTITKANNNVVYTIDDIPAAKVYGKYLGSDIEKQLPATGIEFPLIIQKNDFSIARAVIAKNDDDSLVFAGNLKTGDKVHFGFGNVETIMQNKTKIAQRIQKYPIESIFVYSCMARKRLLKKNIQDELAPLATLAPLSGFFTYGELYHNSLTNTNELLNETMTIVAISEDKTSFKKFNFVEDKSKTSQTIKALSHLISVTSSELQTLNEELEKKVAQQVDVVKKQQKQLIAQAKHATMGEMLSMIAHQWRQPLAAINSTTNTLNMKILTDMIDEDFFSSRLQRIDENVKFLSDTIDNFRNFFKTHKEMVEASLENIIERAINLLKATLENNNIELETNYNSFKKIVTYPNELEQVVLNLVKNAEDVMKEKHIKNKKIIIQTFIDNKDICFSVEDNGGGVDEKIIERIFEPYFTTKAKLDGTGLGLYMSKIIVEEHCSGTISVTNTSMGAKFTVRFTPPIINQKKVMRDESNKK